MTDNVIDRHRLEVIVAHSQGSVGVYAAPRPPGRDVDLVVTLDRPLAMPVVVLLRLTPATRPGGRPPRVQRWLTFVHIGDLVAVPGTDLR